jgi:hypothetical protein
MTKDAIQQTLHAQPLKPFAMRLADGKLVPVPHPDFILLTQGGRAAIATGEAEQFSIVGLGLVTALEIGNSPAKPT